MIRRQTFIALRARRTALGIARAVMYGPPMEVNRPPPPPAAIPAPDPHAPPPPHSDDSKGPSDRVLWVLFAIGMVYLAWWAYTFRDLLIDVVRAK
jgi:hypothetical protein